VASKISTTSRFDKPPIQRLGQAFGCSEEDEALIERFADPVFNLISRLVDDPSNTLPVVLDVFLKVFRDVGSFRDERTLRTSVYRIAVNEALGAGARGKLMRAHQLDKLYDYNDSLRDFGRPCSEAMVENETLVEEALRKMNPKLRTALVLREIDGLGHEEIADILDVSVNTAKSRISRGWDALRKHLDGSPDMNSALERLPQLAD
jgi:RNA polymerase sigma-70 factor, ECF subfamily